MITKHRAIAAFAVLLFPVMLSAAPQSADSSGWSFAEAFQGTSNSLGVVMKENSTLAYQFNPHVQTYVGLPVYLVRASSNIVDNPAFMGGIGNAFGGLLLTANSETLHYSSDLMFGAPTGERSRGFSTGHATVDWTNTFSHSFGIVTPYASLGAGNTISDTSFFVRPFTTNGVVGHGEAGALFDVAPHVTIGGSGYILRAHGQQEVVSKVITEQTISTGQPVTVSQSGATSGATTPVQGVTSLLPTALNPLSPSNPLSGLTTGQQTVFESQTVTTVAPEFVNDQGFSAWLKIQLNTKSNFQIGYSRSDAYQLNSLFFGVGVRIGH